MIDHAVILAIGDPAHDSQVIYNRAPAMLPALGKPLFARLMDRLYHLGVREYTVIVGENEGTVTAYINRQWLRDIKVNFEIIQYSNFYLRNVLQEIAKKHPQPFFVLTYNSFSHPKLPETLLNITNRHPNALVIGGAMTTLSTSQKQTFAQVEGEQITTITEKTPAQGYHLIDMAICGHDFIRDLQEQVPDRIENRPLTIFADYLKRGGQALFGEAGWTLQVQTDTDLLALNRYMLIEGNNAHILSEIPYTVKIIPPVRIDPQVSVGQGAQIGPNVYLERGCSIGRETVLHNTVILQKVNIRARSTVHNCIVTTRGNIPLPS